MDLLQTFASSLDEATWGEIYAFLEHYGYLSGAAGLALANETATRHLGLDALRRFQAFYGIQGESAAELKEKTLEKVRTKRCGVTDFEAAEARPPGCAWSADQRILIYEVENEPAGLNRGEAKAAIDKAINIWNEVLRDAGISLTLQKRNARRRSSIVHVRFSWKRENSREIRDVVGTPIAHADFPPACGLLSRDLPRPVVFNPEERWSAADNHGPDAFDIAAVAVHEIGHILGLPHSENSTSVMFPALFPGDRPTPEDREALATLYALVGPEIMSAGAPNASAHP